MNRPYPISISHERRCKVASELAKAFLEAHKDGGALLVPFSASFARAICAITRGMWAELEPRFVDTVLRSFAEDHDIWIFVSKGS